MTDQLPELLERLASAATDVTIDTGEGVTEFRRAGQLFAVSDEPTVIELRLLPDVAEAARRTPATGDSTRGADWVRFAPPEWDDHATDRLEAWFRVAWRLAGERR